MIQRRIRFQPMPTFALVATVETASGPVSAITRKWADGDAARCRFCPEGRCSAFRGVCQVVVNVAVGDDEGRAFSTAGFRWLDEPGGVMPDIDRPTAFRVVRPEEGGPASSN